MRWRWHHWVRGDTDTITVIADGSTVEVFADGGQVAMASRVYFNGQCEEFHLHYTPGVTVLHTNVIAPTMSGFYHLDVWMRALSARIH